MTISPFNFLQDFRKFPVSFLIVNEIHQNIKMFTFNVSLVDFMVIFFVLSMFGVLERDKVLLIIPCIYCEKKKKGKYKHSLKSFFKEDFYF